MIAAGSTGSIPATAELLSVIARLPQARSCCPGSTALDELVAVHRRRRAEPSVLGHPQYGLAKLLRQIGVCRADVVEIGAARTAAGAARG